MASPRVSFVVTCFNLGAFLPETLASIRAQTFTDFDICIVDDGSTDALTAQALGEAGSDVLVVRSENRGLPAARNLGVSRTSGEFICTVDADDLLSPTLLARSVARLDADPSLSFVSHWLEAFGDQTWDWKPERCDFPALLDTNTVNGAALVRRSAVEAVDGWDETLRDGCEDWDFWITLVERGFRGEIIPEVLFRYRRRPDSMSRLKFADDGLSRLYRRLVDKHLDTYRTHLKELLTRRDVDVVGNRAVADAQEERLELTVLPARARARDDLAAAERRRSRWEAARRVEEEQRRLQDEVQALRVEAAALQDEGASLRGEIEALRGQAEALRSHAEAARIEADARRSETDSLRTQLESDRAEVLRLDRLRHQAAEEAAALRASLSWRLMGPLRSMGSLVHRAGRRRRS